MASKPKKIKVKPNRPSSCEIFSSKNEAEVLSLNHVQVNDGGRLINSPGRTSENTAAIGHPIKAFEAKELEPRSKESCCSLHSHFHVVLLYIVTMIAIAILGLVILAVFGMIDVCKCSNEAKRVAPSSNMEKDLALLWKSVNATIRQLNQINSSNSLNYLQQKVRNITAKVTAMESTVTQMQHNFNGSVGSSGSPGSPGPSGPKGLPGPAGPKGGGNMTMCLYKKVSKAVVAANNADTDVVARQESGMKILGVSCSTNGAAEYMLTSSSIGPSLTYKCQCKGQSTLFISAGKMYCYIHYWECPLVS